jgi:hypothetical protein
MPMPGEGVSRVRLRLGADLAVRDLTDAGICVEGSARLLPGRRIDVHVVTRSGRVLVRATIVRAQVSDVRADSLTYRAALSFDQAIDTSPSDG